MVASILVSLAAALATKKTQKTVRQRYTSKEAVLAAHFEQVVCFVEWRMTRSVALCGAVGVARHCNPIPAKTLAYRLSCQFRC